jgi:serine/threonine-protein kinase
MALPNKAKIPVGTVLAGKYRITREIGRGGMAAVYEAANVDIGKRVAIKVLAQELTASAVVVERFLREARAAAAIRSPFICDIYDSGRLDDGRPFLVLELLEGESLYERMTKIRWLDVDQTVTIVNQTCRGLTKAHAAQIVHRDLKPENIFLTKDEEGSLLSKILDFGLAKFYAPMEGGAPVARLTREGAVFGTPAYMSPEQVRGQGAVDHRADLWALGCIVYECFTGRTVWSTDQGVAMTFAQIANAPLPRPSAYRPDLPPGFTKWFDRALNRDITTRFQTAKEFSDELTLVFFPDRAPIESSSMTRPIAQLLASPPSVPSVRVYPASSSAQPAMPEATTEPPPQPSSPASMPHPAANPAPHFEAPKPNGEGPAFPSGGFGTASNASAASFVAAHAEAPPEAKPTDTAQSKLGFSGPESRQAADTATPERPSRGLRKAAIVGALAAAVGSAGVVVWSQLIDPPVRTGTTASASASGSASAAPPLPSGSPSATPSATPRAEQPMAPWMTLVREAQQTIAGGDLKGASKQLKEAFEKSVGHGVPRTMMEHLAVAQAAGDRAPCKLTGLGRPRAYDLGAAPVPKPPPAGRPTIAVTDRGAVVIWTDAHDGAEHAWAASLDEALRDQGAPLDVTPEATAVARPELRRAGDKLILVYGDAKGAEAGVRARFLDPDGRIGGPSVAVSAVHPAAYAPVLAPLSDGSSIVAWTEEEGDSEDLFWRKLDPSLTPSGEVVRATDLVPAGPSRPRVRWPSVAIGSDALLVAYRMERDPLRLIQELRLPLGEAGAGLGPLKKGDRKIDRTIGEVVLVNTEKAKSDAPSIACGAAGCFIAWYAEGPAGGLGVSAAFLDPAKAQPIWRRKLTRVGARPSIAVAPSGQAQLVWFEANKLVTASLTRDGMGPPTRFARVSGDQPAPAIAPGTKPGEWYVAWLDYEIGHLEAYAARVQCK